MMKRLLAALLFLAPNAAWATCSSVPYTFTPNTLAQSGQVNANFAAVVNCANTIDASQITTGVLPVARGGTNNPTWTIGSVVFATASTQLGQDNSNLFWDSTNHRLGILTNTPAFTLDVNGVINAPSHDISGLLFANSSGGYFRIHDPAGNDSFIIGSTPSSSDPTNYYRNSVHEWQSIGGGATFASVTSSLFTINVPLVTGSNINASGAVIATSHLEGSTLNESSPNTAGSATTCLVLNAYVSSYYGVTGCASDERLKNIGDSLSDGLSLVDQLKPVNYTWKDGVEKHPRADEALHAGFVAQDVKKLMPACVTKNPDDYLSLDSNCLIAYLAKAIQELDAKVSSK